MLSAKGTSAWGSFVVLIRVITMIGGRGTRKGGTGKRRDIPAVQTGHPPWPPAKSTISEWTRRRNLLARVKIARG
jgi:hypothetical protein